MMQLDHASLSCDIACNIFSTVHRRLLNYQNLLSMRTTSQGAIFVGEHVPRNNISNVVQIEQRSYSGSKFSTPNRKLASMSEFVIGYPYSDTFKFRCLMRSK